MALSVRRNREQTPVRGGWDPFRELNELQERMGDLIDGVRSRDRDGEGVPWIPLVDVEETEDAWIVEADLPGVDRADVNVETRESELIVTGEIKERERKGILRRRTRRTGEFEYRVVMPPDADLAHVEASLERGVLTIRIPKSEQQRPRRIEVQTDR